MAALPSNRRVWSAAAGASLALVVALVMPGAARGDTAPVPPEPVATVAADALPTVQINGVAWSQIVVGNRVYVTGSFTRARPAGAAAGTNETVRQNILAYNLTTGELITSWAPSLNAQGLGLAASPDGSRIYVVGEFTSVSGVARQRIAALDANTGAVVTGFNASLNNRARGIAVSGSTVYVGGIFGSANGASRTRLASFSASNGAVTSWNPTADAEVMAVVAPAGGKIVVGGRFSTLGGVANYGMGAVNATTGAAMAWPTNQIVRNGGVDAAIYSLSTNGSTVFGTGYTYGGGGNFEGTFASDAATGALTWVTGCRGDMYSSYPIGGVLYSVGHPHDCAMVGGNPELSPRQYQYALGQTVARGPDNAVNTGGTFNGRPAPYQLHWLPTLSGGTYTGASQAAWSVAGNDSYVVLGGEFPRVNGTAQQGLTRFAVRSLAPNRQGPQGNAEMTPTLAGAGSGRVNVTWKTAWDRDNKRLTYEVLRGSTVVHTRTADTRWWSRPTVTFTDTTAPPGTSQSYRIRARDPLGNAVTSATATITVPGTVTPPPTGNTLATDTFGRTTTSGLGDAEVGGTWSGTGANVTDGAARAPVAAGGSVTLRLGSVSSSATDVVHDVWLEGMPTGGGAYLSTIARGTAAGDYRAKLKLTSNGQVTVQLVGTAGGAETALTAAAAVPGVTYTAGQKLRVRVQAVGTSPTTVRARVWPASGAEPGTWQAVATDATTGLQTTGSIGWFAYASGTATASTVYRFDDLSATRQ